MTMSSQPGSKRTLAGLAVIGLVAITAVVADFVAGGGNIATSQAAIPRFRVSGGAASMDELISRFLEAVRAKDRGALEKLRFTEEEYREVLIPGFVPEGQPPKVVGADASKYFYDHMNTRSFYHLAHILRVHGGKQYRLERYAFDKGSERYAWFTAHRRLKLLLVDEAGNEIGLQTGSIAEVDGHFKFASYVRD
jgi:hypothetical protein